MILTCPACGTRYVVKDGAIPDGGRQVRCASCKHSWHQDPETAGSDDQGERAPITQVTEAPAEASAEDLDRPQGDAPIQDFAADADAHPLPEPTSSLPADAEVIEQQAFVPAADSDQPHPQPAAEEAFEHSTPVEAGGWAGSDEDYSPFAARDMDEEPRSRGPLYVLLALILIAAAAAAIWFLAPPQVKQRLGIAAASEETPLLLQVEQHSRQQLASGNQLLEVSGRVINPTDQAQRVPPLQAQLRSLEQKVVYSWTIPPPAQVLAPGGSATFNSAELNIPSAAACLDVSFGQPMKPSEQRRCEPTQGGTTAAG